MDSNPLIQSLLSSLNVDTSRYLALFLGIVSMNLRAGGGSTKKMSESQSTVPDPMHFSGPYFPYLLEEP